MGNFLNQGHTIILSATLMAMLKNDKIQDLGPHINYPMFLEPGQNPVYEVVTLRYDEYKLFEGQGWARQVMLKGPVKEWLLAQVAQ